jgi:hypothetical protein
MFSGYFQGELVGRSGETWKHTSTAIHQRVRRVVGRIAVTSKQCRELVERDGTIAPEFCLPGIPPNPLKECGNIRALTL